MNCLLPVTDYDIRKRTSFGERLFFKRGHLERLALERRNREYRASYAHSLQMAKIAAHRDGFEVVPDMMSEHGYRAVRFYREKGVTLAEWREMDRFGAIPNPDRSIGSVTRSVTASPLSKP